MRFDPEVIDKASRCPFPDSLTDSYEAGMKILLRDTQYWFEAVPYDMITEILQGMIFDKTPELLRPFLGFANKSYRREELISPTFVQSAYIPESYAVWLEFDVNLRVPKGNDWLSHVKKDILTLSHYTVQVFQSPCSDSQILRRKFMNGNEAIAFARQQMLLNFETSKWIMGNLEDRPACEDFNYGGYNPGYYIEAHGNII